MTRFKKFITVLLAVVMASTCFVALAACKKTKFNNEKDRLILSIGELDGVFNPFFSSSATDGSIIGMTQIGMLSSDSAGNVAYGKDEPCVVLDYEESTEKYGKDMEDWRTTYKFVLKNDLKFSNGSPLTMRDVLFNLYVYLDPAYTGSSTIYSTEIVGLEEYRTQTTNTDEQKAFREQFEVKAYSRRNNFVSIVQDFYDKDFKGQLVTDKMLTDKLKEKQEKYQDLIAQDPEHYGSYQYLVADYEHAKELFLDELNSDYTSAGDPTEIKFNEDRVHLNYPAEAFLYNEGYIYWDTSLNGNRGGLQYTLVSESEVRNISKEDVIQRVYEDKVPRDIIEIVTGWQTATTLLDEFTAQAMKEYFDSLEGERIWNVSGITFPNRPGGSSVTVKDTTYEPITYNEDGSVKSGNEVLQIVIKGIDPKAIWNFAYTVAPMYYYSTRDYNGKDYIAAFDFEQNFGLEFGDIDFMNDVIKDPNKIGVPVGAGPYQATTRSGEGTPTRASFWDNNVCYYKRNDYFMFPVNIKYVNYKVVDPKMMLTSLFNGEIHFAEPNCTQENINLVESKSKKGFEYKEVQTNGYGYIGINAEKIPDVNVRRAIMHAIDTSLCLEYYRGHASAIYRPMTRASWAYPKQTDTQGQYYKYDRTGATSLDLIDDDYNVFNKEGVRTNSNGDVLKYTFTIAGDSEDHPAYNAMINAAEILNSIGFRITVQKDINALKKLNTGDLTVWAAAWGSGVDPDMYQVYHIESQAGATANWGYRAIRNHETTGKYEFEYDLIANQLSPKIDEARKTTDIDERTQLYAEALDLVMELAVELPTYQRNDMFAYSNKVLDVNTMNSHPTSFDGPLSRLWELSFVGNKTK